MSVSAVNVNPLIAKDMKNGNLLCMICNTQKRHAARQFVSKRPAPEDYPQPSSSVPSKKPREERVEEEMSANFTPAQTPWQRGTKNVENRLKRPIPKNVIEGVPEGFFDDEKLNNRVVETIERQANMEHEYANFLNELNEAEKEEEEREDLEEQTSAIEHDIEHIDEQIDHWRRVNRLELRRDEIYKLSMKETEMTRILKDEEVMSDDDSVELDNPCNWRNKGI
uniref:ZNF380 coiled-coil domain-containing protein n=1 Tax=Parascaris equorum TaxID=6256 RepID=A0A914RB19_PAREQ